MELTKKERREQKREERRQEATSLQRKKKIKTWLVWVAVALAVLVAGYFGYRALFRLAQIPEIGESFPIEGERHVADGTKVEYGTNPPSSGAHYAAPANWGFYGSPLPDEQIVHNLEHGGVWIAYRPDLDSSVKKELESLVDKYRSKVIATPREENDSQIALVSWGRIHKMSVEDDGTIDENVIINFIKKYKNTGPELVPD